MNNNALVLLIWGGYRFNPEDHFDWGDQGFADEPLQLTTTIIDFLPSNGVHYLSNRASIENVLFVSKSLASSWGEERSQTSSSQPSPLRTVKVRLKVG